MSKPEQEHEKITYSYREIGAMERHVLDIQSRCRLLSSLWLLGTFAGMAYILSENLNLHISNELIFVGINTSGLFGICLLWTLDLLVYHRQLVWIMKEGHHMEEKYHWLPKLRKFRQHLMCGMNASPRIIWFYFIQTFVLTLIGGTSLAVWLFKHHHDKIAAYTSLYLMFVFFIIILVYLITNESVLVNNHSKRK